MSERICRFGGDAQILGILTEPGTTHASRGMPAVILLNAGLLHHVGQNRVNVVLARLLAHAGFCCFRFDFSGMGDSRAQASAASVRERNTAEIRLAMDYLERSLGIKSFVLIGLCTGADNAHRAAVADARVTAVVMLDGYAYPTMGYLVRRFRKKVFRPSNWKNFTVSWWNRLRSIRQQLSKQSAEQGTYFWVLPRKRQTEKDLRELVKREVRMLQIFSGSNIAYNYEEQYRESFRDIDLGPLLQVSYMAEADHTYSIRADRERMMSTIETWLCEIYRSQAYPDAKAAS